MQKLSPEQEYQRKYRAANLARLREQKKQYYAANREKILAHNLAYRNGHREQLRAYDKRRRQDNPDRKLASDRAYHAKNREANKIKRAAYWRENVGRKRDYDIRYRDTNKERLKKHQLDYYDKNKAAYIARVVKRNAQKLKALPRWANEFFMSEAYHLAALRTKMFGYPWHVDHIVPLQSKLVCGLHVHNNLRVIPAIENNRKGNRHWPDMP